MKLINALRMIEEREKRKRKAEKEMRRNVSPMNSNTFDRKNPGRIMDEGSNGQKNLVHVQSIFPQEDIVALKVKTGEAHVRDAISKAVYFYLKCAAEECN